MITQGFPAVMTIWLFLAGPTPQVATHEVGFQRLYSCQQAQEQLKNLALPKNVTLETTCNIQYHQTEECTITDYNTITTDTEETKELIQFSFTDNSVSIASSIMAGDYCYDTQKNMEAMVTPNGVTKISICASWAHTSKKWNCIVNYP